MAQALHAGGPVGLCHGSFSVTHAQMAQGHDRGPGVFYLVRAGKVGQRQVQQSIVILKDQPTTIFERVPMLAMHQQRRAKTGGTGFDHFQTVGVLRANHASDTALDNARLFACDFGQGVTEVLLMIKADRGDDGQRGMIHHIGAIQTPAKAHFQQCPIGRHARKRQKRRTRGNFKERDAVTAVGNHAFIQQGGEGGFTNQLPRQPDAFMKPREMR